MGTGTSADASPAHADGAGLRLVATRRRGECNRGRNSKSKRTRSCRPNPESIAAMVDEARSGDEPA